MTSLQPLPISFNGDSTCFAVGDYNSFSVYNCDPFSLRFKRGGINSVKFVEPLFRSNFVMYVTNNEPQMLVIWDEYQGKKIAELEFDSDITSVRWKRNIILATTVTNVYLYNFENMKLIKSWEHSHPAPFVNVRTTALANTAISTFAFANGSNILIYNNCVEKVIKEAHLHPIAAIDITTDGRILATVSSKGTIIRLWNLETCKMIKEFRRGLDGTSINCLKFDNSGERLLATSDKETVHIFSLAADQNKKSTLGSLTGYLPAYFSSEWSMITITAEAKSWCAFDNNKNDVLYVVTPDRQFKTIKYSVAENSAVTIANFTF